MNERPYVGLKAALAILTVIVFVVGANAATETVLYNFRLGTGGSYPYASLVFDAAGNLYGTTALGGDLACNEGFGCGIVFELTPKGNGDWKETVPYRFNGANGFQPLGNVVF